MSDETPTGSTRPVTNATTVGGDGRAGRKIAIWVITIIASAVLTAVVKDWWESPKPSIELTRLQLIVTPSSKKMSLSQELKRLLDDHAYLESPKEAMTYDGAVEFVENIKDRIRLHSDVVAWFDSALDLIGKQSAAISLESRRHQLIQMISDEPSGKSVELTCRFVVDDIETQLDAKYLSHPKGQTRAVVNLPNSVYYLGEQPEDQTNTGNRLDAHRANIYRRILLLYEPDVLVKLFSLARDRLKRNNNDATALLPKLQLAMTNAFPMSLAAEVLVSNRGQRPMAVRTVAIVKLRVPSQNSSAAQTVPIRVQGSSDGVAVVEGGKAVTLTLYSEPIERLISANPKTLGGEGWSQANGIDGSRLMLLYHAKTGSLLALVALARAGTVGSDLKLGESQFTVVGSSTEDEIVTAL
jgi:hypothetical protein